MKVVFLLLVLLAPVHSNDRFNYDKTNLTERDFGPSDWGEVACEDVETCPGWPTNWEDLHDFIPYDETSNLCVDCTSSVEGECMVHKQSPINLQWNPATDRECVDRHRMNYRAGQCKLNQMDFQILPHVLRVYQPDKPCTGDFQPGIDFSKGFPEPWLLKFTDISTPSQHQMNGKSYHAEVVLSHVYSVDSEKKLIGNVALFLEKGKASDHYDFLELYLEGWKRVENKVRRICESRRKLVKNLRTQNITEVPGNWRPYAPDLRELAKKTKPWDPRFRRDTSEPQRISKIYYDREWHPYDWYVKGNTEYYYRYEGSMPEPPCFEGVHWRVIKNPIKVAPRQIRDLHDLLANRLDPDTCEYYTAGKHRKPGGQKVDVNRPIQLTTRKHKLVYCECIDWDSKNPDDIAHCESLATLSISSNTSTSLIPSTSPTPVPATTTSPQPSTTSS